MWNTDATGNWVSNAIGGGSGSTAAFEAFENTFHQDLNGDGLIGVPAAPTVIEALGSTKLDLIGSSFFLDPVGGGTGVGPILKYAGVNIVAGASTWVPLGVEATASGYQVAWKLTGADTYTVWNTDSNGNWVSNAIGGGSGSTAAFEAFENSFHQDLNGDGVIGVPSPVSPGVAPSPISQPPAVTIASNDSFVFAGGDADPLQHFGSSVTAGQFAALFHEAPAAQPQTVVQPINDAHGAAADPGHYDSLAAVIGLHVIDPHFGGFVIG